MTTVIFKRLAYHSKDMGPISVNRAKYPNYMVTTEIFLITQQYFHQPSN